MAKLTKRLPIILSATALLVAIFGGTPLGDAALEAFDAQNANKVDGFHAVGASASTRQRKGKLIATSAATGKLPAGAIPGLSSVNGLAGASCGAYGQKGTVEVVYDKTAVRLECEGIVAPDDDEPNNTRANATPTDATNIEATISPRGDVDWYELEFDCSNVPDICAEGLEAVLTSPSGSVRFDGYVDASGIAGATAVTNWESGSFTDSLSFKIYAPAPSTYRLEIGPIIH